LQSQRLLVQLHWVWFSLQFGTKHPIDLGFILILLDESTTVTTMKRDWDFGNVVCLYCHLFFFVFETVRENNVSICLESLSLTSGTLSHAFSWLLPWLVFVLGHFVSHLTCRFRTFVFCKVTGLLVFILNTSCLSWTPRAYFGFLELKTRLVVTHVCPRCFYISKIVGVDCPGYYSRLLARPAKAI
jgi:hypothetical protein